LKTYLHNGIRILYNSESSARFNMHKEHFHDEYEIYYLINGSRQFYINDKVYPLSGGSLAFVDGEDMHRTFCANNEPHTRFVVCIKKEKLQREFCELTKPFLKGGALSLSLNKQKEMQALIDMIKKECDEVGFMHHEAIYSLVTKLLIDVSRLYCESASIVNDCCEKAVRIIDFINLHYGEKFSLEDISESCNISISHLTRLFKSSTGYSIVEYTNNLRIKKAAELIKNTNLSISEIAQKVGFASFSYFGKLFLQCYGVSPLKYRNS